MISVLSHYLPLLLLTLAIELGVIAAVAPRPRRRTALAFCIGLNLVTHPIATLLSWQGRVDIVSLEVVVILAEWLGYGCLLGLRAGPALRCSLLANVASALAGFGIWILGTAYTS